MINIKLSKTKYLIESLSEDERLSAVQFIGNDEYKCTVLVEQLLHGAQNVYVLKKCENKISKMCALFFIRHKSTIFHYFSNYDNFGDDSLKKVLQKWLKNFQIFCVYGEEQGTRYLNSLIKNPIIKSNEYILMINDLAGIGENAEIGRIPAGSEKDVKFDGTSVEKIGDEVARVDIGKVAGRENEADGNEEIFEKNADLENLTYKIKKCLLEDKDKLKLLEKFYRKEEVAITDKEEDDKIIDFVLNNSLLNQKVFAAFVDAGCINLASKAVCKVQTNGQGKSFCQIGGVYTLSEWRNKKICYNVLKRLLCEIKSENKKAVLFVKVKNFSAQKVYKNLGFVEVGRYVISYFQK